MARVVILIVLPALALARKYMHCNGAPLCGVLTLESGLGSGVYSHPSSVPHGLWPQVDDYGDSQCIAPQQQTPIRQVYRCYRTGSSYNNAIDFQEHEWYKHGLCAGVEDADDFFHQICELADPPCHLMDSVGIFGSWKDMIDKVRGAGYYIYSLDNIHKQMLLSACAGSDGKWKLTSPANFRRACGGVTPAPAPPPPPPPAPGPAVCVHSHRGPRCYSNSDCVGLAGCKRCAKSGYCTDLAAQFREASALASMPNVSGNSSDIFARPLALATTLEGDNVAPTRFSGLGTMLAGGIAMGVISAGIALHMWLSRVRLETSEQYMALD